MRNVLKISFGVVVAGGGNGWLSGGVFKVIIVGTVSLPKIKSSSMDSKDLDANSSLSALLLLLVFGNNLLICDMNSLYTTVNSIGPILVFQLCPVNSFYSSLPI